MFLYMGSAPVRVGEIVVFNIAGRRAAQRKVSPFGLTATRGGRREIPIVHRAIRAHTRAGSEAQEILTKGDNNYGDDKVRNELISLSQDGWLFSSLTYLLWQQVLYAAGQDWLNRQHIMGRAVGYLPHVGRVTIIMNDYPYIKYLLIAVLGMLVVTSKE